ncbi:MAG: aminotransferase class I/II-fold pyridoxal phosphate-dependent enzyme [Mariprofundaceae bacterium]
MRRIETIEPFRVMQLLERAKAMEAAGRRVIHMEIGEPDFSTPASVIAAAHRALDHGDLHYTPSTGLPALQAALADWYAREYGVRIAPERILITPGTSGAFSMIYAALLDPGEAVLLPDPGYPCQRNFVRLAGGEPVNAPVGPGSRYHLDASHVARHWRAGMRAAVLINPGNPTGTVVDAAHIGALAAACRAQGGVLISDEIYHGLTADGVRVPTALAVDDEAIVVNGFSKRWAMTGWRIGWVVVPERLLDACRRVMQNIFIAAPTLSQHVAIAALAAEAEVEAMRRAFDARRRLLLERLPKLGFEIVVRPEGAFYIYANVRRLTDDARDFCWRLLEEEAVAITPGEDFGAYRAAEHVRFSCATGMDEIEEGLARIARFLDRP